MILQGKTPRALTGAGLLSVAGVGLLLLPLVFSRAQDVQANAQPDEKKMALPVEASVGLEKGGHADHS